MIYFLISIKKGKAYFYFFYFLGYNINDRIKI